MTFKDNIDASSLHTGTSTSNGSCSKTLEHDVAEQNALTIVLTGSTGNLGTYILDHLLQCPRVSKIFCLNRSTDSEDKQKKAFESRGLSAGTKDQVTFIKVDYEAQDLGISQRDYSMLKEKTSVIIHNAWPVDFNRKLTSFESCVRSVDFFIRLAQAQGDCPQPPGIPEHRLRAKIIFCSSAAVALDWASYASTSRDKIPEVELVEWRHARTGYGQSKLLSERLLARAAKTSGLSVSIARIGQLAGPVSHGEKGAWPRQEWIPSMIQSSLALGVIPSDLGPNAVVDWVPVDLAAQILTELTLSLDTHVRNLEQKDWKAEYFHITNPTIVQWQEILPTIHRCLPGHVTSVPFKQWVDALEQESHAGHYEHLQGAHDDLLPAVKLWETFRYMRDRAIRFPGTLPVTLDTTSSRKRSSTLNELQPVTREWMELWMRQWGYVGKESPQHRQ